MVENELVWLKKIVSVLIYVGGVGFACMCCELLMFLLCVHICVDNTVLPGVEDGCYCATLL